jgi:hypothetical protein
VNHGIPERACGDVAAHLARRGGAHAVRGVLGGIRLVRGLQPERPAPPRARDGPLGFCSILVGATRKPPPDPEQYAADIDRIYTIVGFANGNFNNGLRAYYFGMAARSWFVHPILMIVATLAVVYVLHTREFRSRTLRVLLRS